MTTYLPAFSFKPGIILLAAVVVSGNWGCGAKDQPPPTPQEAAEQPPLEAPKGEQSSKQSELPD